MPVTWIERMAVDVRGDGDAVVLVHGLGGSINTWTPVLPALARFRCIRPELPGAARSSKAYDLGDATPHRGRITTGTHVQALLRVFDALRLDRAHVAGHSYGTVIALQLAAAAPDRVRSLALFGAMAEPSGDMRAAMRARADAARAQVAAAPSGGSGGLFDVADAVAHAGLSASTKETQPTTVAYVRETVAAQDPEGYARNCLALADTEPTRIEQVRCPVLVVNGDEDIVTTLSGARALAGRLPDARLEVLPRCGHWPTFERATESQRLLREFLERQR
jgi:pimeloyl-ACP methyl ester carboxylesterase